MNKCADCMKILTPHDIATCACECHELDEQARNWRAIQRAYPNISTAMLKRARERGLDE